MLRTAMTYKANANISGGSKTGSYSASASYLNKEGILRNTSHESYNIRLKSDYSFLDNRLVIGESLIVRLSKGEGNINQDTMGEILRFPQSYRYLIRQTLQDGELRPISIFRTRMHITQR